MNELLTAPSPAAAPSMLAEGTHYLVRFDDICPTMNWAVWDRIEAILLAHDIRPIVAVVPDNQDRKLVVGPPVEGFWERVRTWQSRKWSIALHGYQHRYVNAEGGILGLSRQSEFAGLPKSEQDFKLRAGLAKFAEEGVRPDAWVAPSHSFDETTVQVLAELGIRVISDGLTVLPFEDRNGVTWVPQQLWGFHRRNQGVWTICLHHNVWTESDCERFSDETREFRPNIKTLDEILRSWPGRARDMRDRLHELSFRARLRFGPGLAKLRHAVRIFGHG